MLGISTKSYMSTGEIAGYAQKVSGVARAAKLIKRGAYIGVALDVASAGLSIRQACALGREDECTKAKYVEGSSLAGSLVGGGVIGGFAGQAAIVGCMLVLGIASGGSGAIACGVVGGAVGGIEGGLLGEMVGERVGEFLYETIEK
ncbi:hypothetical protein [Pseudomonas sp. GM55]|uniref:hypothetical protein n=1 Tax=Pseudomonas sp. GM55 TaxID=1144333 RepID=UPI001EE659FC|nr:hypothetical protein [Pseudomonas sp. GM55]